MSETNASPMPRSTRMKRGASTSPEGELSVITGFIIHNYAAQEATPMAPAMAVSIAMRILRICFQSVFILV